jgi:hypothetical protein
VTLTFDGVEKLLGERLPDAARTRDRYDWWTNTATRSQARSWLTAGWIARPDVSRARVVFVRAGPAQERHAAEASVSKYDLLATFLGRQSRDQTEVQIGFRDIEKLGGTALPSSARTDRTWWANTGSYTHARRWLKAGWRVASVDLEREVVRFERRTSVDRTRRGFNSAIRRFMHGLPADQKQLALSFDELASFLGCGLSNFMRTRQEGWANTATAPWLPEGWRVEKLWLKNRIVVFRRMGAEPPHERIQAAVQRLLADGEVLSVDPVELVNWMKFCSRYGLYFHGQVLYDQLHHFVDSLDEQTRIEADEYYGNCRRGLNRFRDARPIAGPKTAGDQEA